MDQQSQFNKSQKSLAEFYAKAKGVPLLNGPGLPKLDFRGMPDGPIRFASGDQSAGLELTDLHLWIFKRFLEGKELAPELYPLIEKQIHRGQTDDISLSAIAKRWTKWFEELPEPTHDQLAAGVQSSLNDRKTIAAGHCSVPVFRSTTMTAPNPPLEPAAGGSWLVDSNDFVSPPRLIAKTFGGSALSPFRVSVASEL